MRLPIAVSFSAATLLAACSQTAQNTTPKTDDEKAIYGMGAIVADRFGFQTFALTDKEFAMLKAGLEDGANGKSKINQEELEKLLPKIQEFATKRAEAGAAKAKEEGVAYLAKAEKEAGAQKLPSGVIVKITKEGTGAQPVAADTVKVNYEGKLISGKVFDSSTKNGETKPIEFPLAGVIPCWSEGMQTLKVGATAQLTCPSDLAYGPQGHPPEIPGNSTLIFNVELLEIVKAEPAPAAAGAPAPAAGAKAPADAAHKAH
jgi:FKBP-type peptidyl-prolyl cis-trans isomerase